MISFHVIGTPKGQPRARAGRVGRFTRVYDPGTADGWKTAVAAAAIPKRPLERVAGPVSVRIAFWFPRPKTHYGKKGLKPGAPSWHTAKPDCDNLAKAVLDVLTEVGYWHDDCQVVECIVTKQYPPASLGPGMQIWINPELEP